MTTTASKNEPLAVWIVTQIWEDGETTINGVFSTDDKASRFAAGLVADRCSIEDIDDRLIRKIEKALQAEKYDKVVDLYNQADPNFMRSISVDLYFIDADEPGKGEED